MAIQLGKNSEMAVVLKVKDDGSVVIEKFGNTSKNALDKSGSAAKRTDKNWQKMGKTVKTASAILAAAATSIAVGSVVIGAKFEQAISNVASVANASETQMKQLASAARDQAKVSIFTATQAAEAQYSLASAGLDVNQIIAAQGSVMSLAAATQSDLATTSEITTATLSQFGLKATESARVANVFAASISASQATLTKLGGAMRFVGPVAKALDIDIESTTAAISLLLNAGFRGEQAGTILRSSLISLQKPSTDSAKLIKQIGLQINDASGKFIGFGSLISQLADKQLTLNQAATIFGTEAAPGMLALVNQGADAYDKMRKSITGTNKAQVLANKQTDTLTGDWKLMTSALEESALTFYDKVQPFLRDAVQGVTNLITAANGGKTSLAEIQAAIDKIGTQHKSLSTIKNVEAITKRLVSERDAALAALPGIEGVAQRLNTVQSDIITQEKKRQDLLAKIDQTPETARILTTGRGLSKHATKFAKFNDELQQANENLQALTAQREDLLNKSLDLGPVAPDNAPLADPTALAAGIGDKEAAQTAIYVAELQKQVDAFTAANATKEDLLLTKYANEQFLFDDALQAKAISQQQFEQLSLTSSAKYEKSKTKLQIAENKHQVKLQKAADKAHLKAETKRNVLETTGRQQVYTQGLDLLRRFAQGNKAITLLLIALQTAKSVADIETQAAASAAMVLAYGQVEAAAIMAASAGLGFVAAAAAIARSVASSAAIEGSAQLAVGLAIAGGVVDAIRSTAGAPGSSTNPVNVTSPAALPVSPLDVAQPALDSSTSSLSPTAATPAPTAVFSPADQQANLSVARELNVTVRGSDVFSGEQFADGVKQVFENFLSDGNLNLNVAVV